MEITAYFLIYSRFSFHLSLSELKVAYIALFFSLHPYLHLEVDLAEKKGPRLRSGFGDPVEEAKPSPNILTTFKFCAGFQKGDDLNI